MHMSRFGYIKLNLAKLHNHFLESRTLQCTRFCTRSRSWFWGQTCKQCDPAAGAGALLLINILGDGGELVLADFIRNLVTHLARRVDIITHLLGDVLTDLSAVSGALSLSDLPGNSPGHQSTHSPLLVLTVLAGNLGTLDVGDLSTLLLGEAAALSLGSLGALGPGW